MEVFPSIEVKVKEIEDVKLEDKVSEVAPILNVEKKKVDNEPSSKSSKQKTRNLMCLKSLNHPKKIKHES